MPVDSHFESFVLDLFGSISFVEMVYWKTSVTFTCRHLVLGLFEKYILACDEID
jgi:hypothetical protein